VVNDNGMECKNWNIHESEVQIQHIIAIKQYFFVYLRLSLELVAS